MRHPRCNRAGGDGSELGSDVLTYARLFWIDDRRHYRERKPRRLCFRTYLLKKTGDTAIVNFSAKFALELSSLILRERPNNLDSVDVFRHCPSERARRS